MTLTDVLDTALDRSIVFGYTKVGSRLRRLWWPSDSPPGALAGKRVLVTGATSGLGQATASSLAALGATVHLLGRNPDKVRRTAAALRSERPEADVVEEVCDVSDLDAVGAWTDDLTGRIPALHGLVHNAGVIPKERTETAQGHEMQVACHVLGPHLMTERLSPLLADAGGAQVVFVSSGGMYTAALDAGDLASTVDYDGVRTYARTKRMQVVLADAWARRLADDDVRVASLHPGWADTPGVADDLPTFYKLTRPVLRDVVDGADTAVWLVAVRPDSTSPHFWHDRAQRPTTFGWQRGSDAGEVARFLDGVTTLTATRPFE